MLSFNHTIQNKRMFSEQNPFSSHERAKMSLPVLYCLIKNGGPGGRRWAVGGGGGGGGGGGVLLTLCVFCISHYSSLRPLYTEYNKLVLIVYFSEDPNTERFK